MKKLESTIDIGRLLYDGPIVISGIAGRFPRADNVAEFQRNLCLGVDMTTTTNTRWATKVVPERIGLIQNLDKFDARFFNLTPEQANQLDPQTRILMEASFEAILDAGNNYSRM